MIYQILFAVYLAVVTAFLVSENRAPKSSFAWLLLFYILPGLGVLIYVFVGREHKAFIRKYQVREQSVPDDLKSLLEQITTEHEVAEQKMDSSQQKLVSLLFSNANSRLTYRNKLEVLQDANSAYPAMIEALKGAKSSINLHYYSWNSDSIGHRLLALLKQKVDEGVEVRILYDPVGSMRSLSWRYIRKAKKAGLKIEPFSQIWRLHTISYRNHRKIAIIDGKVGFTGGLNIGDEHIEPPEGFARWRDTHIKIEGSAVWTLQAIFLTDWANATDEILDAKRYFGEVEPEVAEAELPVQICLSGPDSEYEAIRQLYFEMITSAQSRVVIQSPFFILDETISEALKMAALSGVQVDVMISSAGPGQYVPYWAANTFAAEVARSGVNVHLYHAGYLHAKTICVDGKICSIGSANWDIRSFAINYELTAVIYDEDIAGEIVAQFDRDLAGCSDFTFEEYRARPRLLRFRDSVARLASPLL